jgi:hypothetical protein
VTAGDVFGTREYLKNNYLYRMAAAALGIYGNSKQEAMYPAYYVDATRQKLDGANRYSLRFAPGQLPPVNAFWSLTMYDEPASLLVANPLNRYLINSPMLPQLKRDAEGGLRLRSRLSQSAFQQLQPVLAPEDLARRQHKTRRAEHARAQCLLRELLKQHVEFGVRSTARAQLRGVKTGALGG